MRYSAGELKEGVKIALEALRVNRMRSVLTTLGILIGVIVVTVIISVIQGLNTYVSGEFADLGADTIHISRWPWIISDYESYLEVLKRQPLDESHYQFIRDNTTLASCVAPAMDSNRKVKYKSESIDRVRIEGSNELYPETAGVVPEFGRFITPTEVEYRRNVCVLGSEVAEKLFKEKNPIGERIKIGAQPYTVVGILEKRGQIFGESMDNLAVIPYTTFMKQFGARRDLHIQIKPIRADLTEDLVDQLTGLMRRARGIQAGQDEDFAINQQSQLMDVYNNLTQVLWIVLIGIGSISLLVGGIGIMNIMLVSVTERTREIGIRKALGAKQRIIMWQFLVESMMISSIGVTLGILISIGIAMLVRAVSPLPVNISAWVVFLGVGFTVAIGLFFGLYPASKAARLNPIVALRFE